ncbi:uncharacterized protein E0L32_003305 [Thyridium curvatum]|uniref:Uncharacterized protein n=1 Tax=Thyridium curvatum TaxID=1093900 RepID=A0A507BBB4_9PEZI|nr:uncharacterized protein E0L32_003305 [Thyridium curvatum]TPX17187.1 hypothetical protein E0L32_003305 [Thyridium curvatum]
MAPTRPSASPSPTPRRLRDPLRAVRNRPAVKKPAKKPSPIVLTPNVSREVARSIRAQEQAAEVRWLTSAFEKLSILYYDQEMEIDPPTVEDVTSILSRLMIDPTVVDLSEMVSRRTLEDPFPGDVEMYAADLPRAHTHWWEAGSGLAQHQNLMVLG